MAGGIWPSARPCRHTSDTSDTSDTFYVCYVTRVGMTHSTPNVCCQPYLTPHRTSRVRVRKTNPCALHISNGFITPYTRNPFAFTCLRTRTRLPTKPLCKHMRAVTCVQRTIDIEHRVRSCDEGVLGVLRLTFLEPTVSRGSRGGSTFTLPRWLPPAVSPRDRECLFLIICVADGRVDGRLMKSTPSTS
jgi:hypothetical protein